MARRDTTDRAAAVARMTDACAGPRAGPDRITVNALAPGCILSDSVQAYPHIGAFQLDAIMRARSLERGTFSNDVEGAVVFLACDDSAFMSGQTLVVDDGSGSVFSTL